jgi:hypothetical protein
MRVTAHVEYTGEVGDSVEEGRLTEVAEIIAEMYS